MKVQEFVDKYNSYTNSKLKEDYVKNSIKNEYISYTEKSAICSRIVNATMHKSVSDGKTNKEIFYCDSANRFILFQIWLIQTYTDIQFSDGENGIREFELLDSLSLNDLIISNIPEREYKNFEVILNMKVDDASINENNFIQYIDTKIDAIRLFFDTFGDSITEVLKDPKVLEAITSAER